MSSHSNHRRSRPTHRQPWKVRWCSFLWIAAAIVFIASLITIGVGFFRHDLPVVQFGFMGLGGFILLLGIAFLSSLGLSCAICANPVFSHRRFKKHARATKFLGFSYRLGIAVPAFFTGLFRCMYCGEKMKLSRSKQR